MDRNIPPHEIGTYDLGTHWPESGDYAAWRDGKLADFSRHYILLRYDTFSTYSGGTHLLAYGVKRDRFSALMAGRACPQCSLTLFPNKAAVVRHLVEDHGWKEESARKTVRGTGEPK